MSVDLSQLRKSPPGQEPGRANRLPRSVALSDLREATDDRDPGSANLSIKGGKAKMDYWWTSTNVADFPALTTLILGSAQPSGAGGITRKPPMAHPRFPSLCAETVTDFAGIGGEFVKEASAAALGPDPFPQYARYPEYRISVEFANRLYNLFSDRDPEAETWHDDNGSGVDVALTYWDCQEYIRWVWVTSGPKENIITAHTGQPGYIDVGADEWTFTDLLKWALPDGAIKLTWYEVPYSFVTSANSFFKKFQGRINQQPFMNWPAGSLLYVTIQSRPYTSPIPVLNSDGVAVLQQLCDIDMIMLETSRTIAPADPTPTPALPNWIAAGWNLQHWWASRDYHYCHQKKRTDPANTQIPLFRSVPFQLLFTDPDVPPP